VRAPDVGHLLFSHESRNPVCVQLHSICTVSWITQFQGTHRRMRELNRNYVEFGFVVILLQTSLFLRRGVQIRSAARPEEENYATCLVDLLDFNCPWILIPKRASGRQFVQEIRCAVPVSRVVFKTSSRGAPLSAS